MQLGRNRREQRAFLPRRRVFCLHHQDRGAPGARFGIAGVGLERQVEVGHRRGEIVPILPQHALQREDLSR